MNLANAAGKFKSLYVKIVAISEKPYVVESFELFGLILLTIIITLIGNGVIKLIYPVGSARVIAVPMVITYLTVYLMIFVISTIFNFYTSEWVKTENIKIHSTLTVIASSYETGFIQAWKRLGAKKIPKKYKLIGIVAALIGLLIEIGIGFDISATTEHGLLSVKGEKFYVDPLTPCNVGDAGCPQFF